MVIRPATTVQDWDQIERLIGEYVEWITKAQGLNLAFQGIEDELESLLENYSPPEGCMLLAEIDGHTVGCAALRPLDDGICEMKRLYVMPDHRGQGIGRALAEEIIREAKSIGYHSMRLDTLNTMQAAQGLYRSLGFKPTQQYYDVPPEIVRRVAFFELSLD